MLRRSSLSYLYPPCWYDDICQIRFRVQKPLLRCDYPATRLDEVFVAEPRPPPAECTVRDYHVGRAGQKGDIPVAAPGAHDLAFQIFAAPLLIVCEDVDLLR